MAIFMPIDALSVSCAQLTRDLLAIAKFMSYSFSKCRVHKFGNRRMDERTDGQVENIMPPPVSLAWQRQK